MNRPKERLRSWDGIHMEHLSSIYHDYRSQDNFFDNLIDWSSESDIQAATTWLIKHHYDSGLKLNKTQTEHLIKATGELNSWEAQLHVLQILGKLEIDETRLLMVDEFVRRCLKSENKFVRAWSYQGLYELYKYGVVDSEELKAHCEIAMETESASIKSRVRKILKQVG